MMHYRINTAVKKNKKSDAMLLEEGEIIGKLCHVIDLFLYLVDSDPLIVSVEALHGSRNDIFPTSNLTVTLRFKDGSVGSLLYTSLGHSGLSKERLEVYCDNKTIVMEDYMKLSGFGVPATFDEATPLPDIGYTTLMHRFFNQLYTSSFVPPIPWDRLEKVAHITLIIDQLACEGGGLKTVSE